MTSVDLSVWPAGWWRLWRLISVFQIRRAGLDHGGHPTALRTIRSIQTYEVLTKDSGRTHGTESNVRSCKNAWVSYILYTGKFLGTSTMLALRVLHPRLHAQVHAVVMWFVKCASFFVVRDSCRRSWSMVCVSCFVSRVYPYRHAKRFHARSCRSVILNQVTFGAKFPVLRTSPSVPVMPDAGMPIPRRFD